MPVSMRNSIACLQPSVFCLYLRYLPSALTLLVQRYPLSPLAAIILIWIKEFRKMIELKLASLNFIAMAWQRPWHRLVWLFTIFSIVP